MYLFVGDKHTIYHKNVIGVFNNLQDTVSNSQLGTFEDREHKKKTLVLIERKGKTEKILTLVDSYTVGKRN